VVWLPLLAALAVLAVLGTDRLGRPMTGEERKRFGALLRDHDYPGARLVALRFAVKLARDPARGQDVIGRVDLRFMRQGWDPAEVSLVKRLCRLVWSEWTHARRETGEGGPSRRAEEVFLRDLEATVGPSEAPVEQRVTDEESLREATARASARLDKLRASFEATGDEVNLLWLGYGLNEDADLDDLQTMATRSGRDVTEFYAAAKRRKRVVRRLLAEERGVRYEEDD
jgi:hypothetical protein